MNPWYKPSPILVKSGCLVFVLGTLATGQISGPSAQTRGHFSALSVQQSDRELATKLAARPVPDLPESPDIRSESYSSSKDHGALRDAVLLTAANWKPLTTKEKFDATSKDLLNPFTQMSLLANAKFSQATNDRQYLGPNTAGLFRRYGLDTADTVNTDFIQGSLLPWRFHEDPRYIPLDSGTRRRRALYALSRIFVVRRDSGREGFNRSKVLGSFVTSGISNLYYPSDRNNGLAATSTRAMIGLGSDATMNLLKEFWPDVAHKVKLKVWISNIVERSLRTATKEE